MKTPFTSEQFFEVFKNYNETIFPLQIIFYLLSIFAVYYAIKPSSKSNKIICGILAFFWLWMGIVYHINFFTAVNKAAYFFGTLFILQGILFLYYGLFQKRLSFKFHSDKYGIIGISMIVYSLTIYPVLGYALGHVYPYSPTFGLPCPTTIFTFGILLFTNGKFPLTILVIPLIWSVIGFTAVFNFNIMEDSVLPFAGILTLLLFKFRNRDKMKE